MQPPLLHLFFPHVASFRSSHCHHSLHCAAEVLFLTIFTVAAAGWLLLLTIASPVMCRSCCRRLLHWKAVLSRMMPLHCRFLPLLLTMATVTICLSLLQCYECWLLTFFLVPPCVVCRGLCHCFTACAAVLIMLLPYPLSLPPADYCFFIAVSTVAAVSWLLLFYFAPLMRLVVAITTVDCCFFILWSSVVADVVTACSDVLRCAGKASTATSRHHLTLLLAMAITTVDCCLFSSSVAAVIVLLAPLRCAVLAQPPLLFFATASMLFLSIAITAVECCLFRSYCQFARSASAFKKAIVLVPLSMERNP